MAKIYSSNLLLATVYALNKSNTKKVLVGLDYDGGYYSPVIKLCSSNRPNKFVSLDHNTWQLICEQMETISAYLHGAYSFCQAFGNPMDISLPEHELRYMTAHGSPAICIEQKPDKVIQRLRRQAQHEAQLPEEVEDESSTSKKAKPETPTIVMQATTFEGLCEVRECINERWNQLETFSVEVNRVIDAIQDCVKEKLGAESNEKAKKIVKDFAAFKQYYCINKIDIENYVHERIGEMSGEKEKFYKILFLEINAYCLANIAKDIYEFMFPRVLEV